MKQMKIQTLNYTSNVTDGPESQQTLDGGIITCDPWSSCDTTLFIHNLTSIQGFVKFRCSYSALNRAPVNTLPIHLDRFNSTFNSLMKVETCFSRSSSMNNSIMLIWLKKKPKETATSLRLKYIQY